MCNCFADERLLKENHVQTNEVDDPSCYLCKHDTKTLHEEPCASCEGWNNFEHEPDH